MDIFSPAKRSEVMRSVKHKNTSAELIVRKYLFNLGYRYRIHVKNLPGKPDIVLKKYKTVIFVHGCFWHGHEDCSKARLPKSRIEFWDSKITRNKERDAQHLLRLAEEGWKVLIVYQCELKNAHIENTMKKLINALTNQ